MLARPPVDAPPAELDMGPSTGEVVALRSLVKNALDEVEGCGPVDEVNAGIGGDGFIDDMLLKADKLVLLLL